ncbi:hypothetical protein [Legionella londiniensis]|uniref:Transmembrane protein n=1 Tax=Legionella londiniensis TaxID=45068 RepID=A0A0W0VLW8_9GAMM|nr:hypothetical protein [Legionella londiniensis]KTD21147.1 hypothetical protein Llon_1245 [Legionella londiniensis]STX93169.1 Uncharacterised protein [Legionella londiniensis]
MPSQKAFYSVGNLAKSQFKSIFFLTIGIIGAIFILFGFTKPLPQIYYVIGSTLLLVTAIYFKFTYFVALELILLAGHGSILLDIGPMLQILLPLMLCLQLLVYYLLSGELRLFRFIGISGIALHSIGFSYENLWIFFFGSLGISIFALYQVFRGKYIALLWAILNLVFVFGTAFMIAF